MVKNPPADAEDTGVQLSRSGVSDSLRPRGLQQARLPVHHQLLEFTKTHVHRVSDAIQPSHPLSSPSPPFPLRISEIPSFGAIVHQMVIILPM